MSRRGWLLIVAGAIAAACGQPQPVPPPSAPPVPPTAGLACTDVQVLADAAGATFHYKTRLTSRLRRAAPGDAARLA
jgi:hypothetical protein